jgi:hypothetical protein
LAAALPHATDFLAAGCYTHVYAGLDATRRARCLEAMTKRHYTHFYLYAYNERDYGGPQFDFYNDPARFRTLLSEIINAGLAPVVWLVPDDAPKMASQSAGAVIQKFERLVPAIDDLVSSYVVGLELDEYWSKSVVDKLGARLAQLTAKPIATHQLPGRWDYCASWCDYAILQYGFGRSADQIDAMTRSAISSLKKRVVAGEYELTNEARAVMLGDRGVAAGAAGFGNGGTSPRE